LIPHNTGKEGFALHKDLQELLICKFYLKTFYYKKVRNVALQQPGQIDPHIGILVKTPKPI
jgi:hypothetical protein